MRALWAALHTDGVRRPHAGRSDRRSRHTEAAAPGQAPAPSLSGLRPGRVLHAVSRSLGGRRQVRPAGPGPPARGSWGRLPRGLLAPSSSRHGQLPAGTTGSGGHPDEAA